MKPTDESCHLKYKGRKAWFSGSVWWSQGEGSADGRMDLICLTLLCACVCGVIVTFATHMYLIASSQDGQQRSL